MWPDPSVNTPSIVTDTNLAGSSARDEYRVERRNFGLDLIRATAICLVLVDHYATVAPVCGILGVELFFVLSGFLIGGILYNSIQKQAEFTQRDVIRFWVRRWMRTLPNYYLFLGVFTVLAMFRVGIDWDTLWPHLFFLQNIAHPPVAFYGVSWSLAVEEWFYLLFPLSFFILYTLTGKSPHTKRRIFLGCAFALAMLSLGLRLLADGNEWSANMRMIVIYRFDALMYGVILAVVRIESTPGWNFLRRTVLVGVMMVLLSATMAQQSLSGRTPTIPAAWLLAAIPVGFAFILPWASHLGSPPRLPALAVGYVSRCSYSVYLCHLPILFLLMQGAHDAQKGVMGKLLIRLSALSLTLVCSGLLYRYLEKPILDLAPKDRYPPSCVPRL